jgi:tRNA(Ile)-lysidine synthetase-like protein
MKNSTIYKSIEAKFKAENWLDKKLVLAVSGGLDSMCMLAVFLQLFADNLENLIVVHFDHQVRPDSKLDFELIQKYLAETNFNPQNLVLEKLDFESGSNFEAEARKKRYEFLEEVRCDSGADFILTAHHLDDQVETVMLNFLKGSFVDGMAGLAELDLRRRLIRPLLPFKKQDLLEFAKKFKVPFITDETNFESKYVRNFLRNEIIPALESKIGSLNSVARNANFYSQLTVYLDSEVEKFLFENLKEENIISRKALMDKPEFFRYKVYSKFLGDYKMSVSDFKELDDLVLNSNTGKYREIGKVKFLIQKKDLEIVV